MPFHELEPKAYHKLNATCAADSITLSTRNNPKGGKRVVLTFGAQAFAKLGWKSDSFIRVFWGTEADRNKLKLCLAQPGQKAWPLSKAKGRAIANTHSLHLSVLPATFAQGSYNHIKMNVDNLGNGGAIFYLPKDFHIPQFAERQLNSVPNLVDDEG